MSLFKSFKKQVSLESQWESLVTCGIRPNPGVQISDALNSWSREEYELKPFELLLVFLGGDREQEPFAPICDSIWHLDTECIEDHGDYARVASRMQRLAGGELPITRVQDYVDLEQGKAWLSFHLDGEDTKWEVKVDNDWIDSSVLSRFVRLLDGRGTKKRFTYLNLKGQDCILGSSTPEEFAKLREVTGLKFEWLG